MLGQPSATPYDLHFRLVGIPLRVHPLFWLVAVLLGLGGGGQPILLLIWVVVVFVSIVVHEMGHALAARGFGMHPSITLWGFGGLTSFDSTRYVPRQHILITLAGPFAGFVLAGFVAILVAVTDHEIAFFGLTIGRGTDLRHVDIKLDVLVFYLLQVNIFWGIINLFPILPLDGGQIARDVLMQINPRGATEQAYRISVVTGALLAVASLMWTGSLFLTIFFGYMAYMSYTTLQALRGGGFGSGRGW